MLIRIAVQSGQQSGPLYCAFVVCLALLSKRLMRYPLFSQVTTTTTTITTTTAAAAAATISHGHVSPRYNTLFTR